MSRELWWWYMFNEDVKKKQKKILAVKDCQIFFVKSHQISIYTMEITKTSSGAIDLTTLAKHFSF